jgi:transposase InsO family protein
MPWKDTRPVDQRLKFIEARLSGEHSMVTLCRMFGISTKTGYKWWHRFEQEGMPGLLDRSRASHSHPNATAEDMVTLVIGARRRHPTWGPRKLRAWLRRKGYEPPAPSTIGDIVRREGLVRPKRRRPRPGCFADGLSAQDQPNAVWAADFKGHFKLRHGPKCYPLTISDGFSRYLLRCEALRHPDRLSAREVFDAAFAEFGLPWTLRTDNGTPFSATHGISELTVWWIQLGIEPERIERGKPTQNGRHERMHRTLKQDAIQSVKPAGSFWAQQRIFDRFRHEYNEERPHEALSDEPPASCYEPSPRRYPTKLREPEYGDDDVVYRVKPNGAITHEGRDVFLSSTLSAQPVGLTGHDDGSWKIHYGPLYLGSLSAKGRLTRGHKRRRRTQEKNDEIPTIQTT